MTALANNIIKAEGDLRNMRFLYGTANPAKLDSMRRMLMGLGLEIIGLNDIKKTIEAVDESGNNPLENARLKALAYYRATNIPVFSCDSGLFIEGIESEKQPGVHVRRVKGRVLTDEEMIAYYTEIAAYLGGYAKAKYKNAICLVISDHEIYQYDGEDISSESFFLAAKPHVNRTAGFPLDSISVEIESGKYYMDLEASESYKSKYDIGQGFRDFFLRVLKEREAAAALEE
jgi:8-oxo-dGTP diphosphatase